MARTKRNKQVMSPAPEPRVHVRVLRALALPAVGALMIVNLYLIFVWAPVATEEHRFNLQRIFYFHVPIAWVALLAFVVVFVGRAKALRTNEGRSVVMTTHNLERGLAWGDRVAILSGGKIAYEGPRRDLDVAGFRGTYERYLEMAP